jgi:hypothetical protein
MEIPAPVQPGKKSNTLIIVIAAIVVLCCCGALVIGGVVALGTSLFSFSSWQSGAPELPIPGEGWDEEWDFEQPFEEEAYDPSIPQGGLGDNDLRRRVWDFITPMAASKAGCEDPIPAATVIVVTEPLKDGVWTEGWTLFCSNGPTPVFRIIFTTQSSGAVNFSPGLISK